MSTTEAQQFWLDNAFLCLANASGPNSSTIATLQNHASTLAGVVAARDATISQLHLDVQTRDSIVNQLQQDIGNRDNQIASLQRQQVQVVDPATYNSLLQELQHLRRFRDATSVAAQAIMSSLNDLSGKF